MSVSALEMQSLGQHLVTYGKESRFGDSEKDTGNDESSEVSNKASQGH